MRFLTYVFIFLSVFFFMDLYAQDMQDYTTNWEGKIEDVKTFNFTVEIKDLRNKNATIIISNKNKVLSKRIELSTDKSINISINDNLSFRGKLANNGKTINGFIKSGLLLYHIKLIKTKSQIFSGIWNILMVDKLKSKNFYLSVENGSGDVYQAYPFLSDNRFTGTWCSNFKKEKDSISFSDIKTGLQFKGKLLPKKIKLGVYINDAMITRIDLKKSESDWIFGEFQSTSNSNQTSSILLKEMELLITKDSLPNTHSILVSKNGKIIYENYFNGYNADIPHDTRSVSKSISSAMVGIAIDNSLFENVEQSIFNFLPKEYQIKNIGLKSKIDIKSLLTMSSGLDAFDWGTQRESVGSEGNYQNSQNWTKTIIDAPMINEPNTHANYGSANPHLLGVAMDSVVSIPLEMFMHNTLFEKLEISNYIIQTDNKGKPYFGGGMYLKPRDMLKFGELYLNKGKWKEEQILSENWVKSSFKNYRDLENTTDKNGYGYLWWHHNYQVNGKTINTIEARGSGGQYIFVIPEFNAVVVITSGNFRNGKFQQPELILKNYLLPQILN